MSTPTVREEVAAMRQILIRLEEKIDTHAETDKRIEDKLNNAITRHGKRIRRIEHVGAYAAGFVAAIFTIFELFLKQ